jgi:ribonuclease T1
MLFHWTAWLVLGFSAQALAFSAIGEIKASALPVEARATLASIRAGGPFPYQRDGSVFGNREAQLPKRERGYYREYTVRTPGARDRGARRIVAGRDGEYYYTDDHYRTFRRIRQ